MISILHKVLYILAQAVLRKYDPIVIGITGTVGKTSVKEAVFTVVSQEYEARTNIKSYNNEIGLPLTILGFASPGRNIVGWLGVFLKTLKNLVFMQKDYPEVLVLEMAADKPGDIKYLTDLAPCNIGVVTAITPVHLALFKNIEAIAKEKLVMLRHLKNDGWALANIDDERLQEAILKVDAQSFSIAMSHDATLHAEDVKQKISKAEDGRPVVEGLQGKFVYRESKIPFFLPGFLAPHQVYTALFAAACGIILDMNLVAITEGLQHITIPPGRLRLLQGKNNTTIIDDSYNSSPEAARAALELLSSYPRKEQARTIAVLGDMNELGKQAEQLHRALGLRVVENNIDILCTYGVHADLVISAAQEAGMSQDTALVFETHDELVEFLESNMGQGDVVLVKGSQNNVRLEKVVAQIMQDQEKVSELLARQGPQWS